MELWNAWPKERFVATPAPCLRHGELEESLRQLRDLYPDDLTLEEVGRSYRGRSIQLLSVGRGSRKVLLWSQMHGDEPSATPALLDIAHFLLAHREDPRAALILDELTLLIVPMLNPDAAEGYQRRNAQGIDVNRDALNLATPEGVVLKTIRAEHEPILGFNLHDQNRRRTVGDTGVLATNALLAVTGDAANTLTPGRARAKRACSAIAAALAPLSPGGMARYDETWSPRAFGDNVTAWGTPVVLLESGGLPAGRPFHDLTRLNFVGLLRALDDLAGNDLADHDPALYDALPDNNVGDWVDVVVRGGHLLQPETATPYRADLGFDVERSDREWAGCADDPVSRTSEIAELGDARFLFAGRDVDAENTLITAPLVVGVEGFDARDWLDPESLRLLGSLGVGTVRWSVAEERVAAATDHAHTLGARGLARLQVASPGDELPPLVLSDRPTRPARALADLSLEALLTHLDGAWFSRQVSRSLEELLGDLTAGPTSRPGHGSSLFRPGARASFLVWSGFSDGRLDPRRTRLRAVWMDGREVDGGG